MHLLATLALALLSPPRRLTPNPAGTHTTPFTSPDGVPLHTALSELKAALLDGYDASTPPAGSDGAAVEITIGLRLNKFHGVDVRRGVMEVGVWLRMWWNDPRLRWNESQHAGIPYFTLAGVPPTDVQLTQVWIPDVELLNGEDSSYNLPQHDVQVSSDGSCAWSRPGVLSSYCDLVGLERFPLDVLSCNLTFGGWLFDSRIQDLVVAETSISNAMSTSWQEYRVTNMSTEYTRKSYVGFAGEYPEASFVLEIRRAGGYYTRRVVLVNILLTLLSFAVCIVDPLSGERLGYSVIILLTLIATDLVIAGMIPVSYHTVWLDTFAYISLLFATAACLENFIVLFCWFKAEPRHVTAVMPRFAAMLGLSHLTKASRAFPSSRSPPKDAAPAAAPPSPATPAPAPDPDVAKPSMQRLKSSVSQLEARYLRVSHRHAAQLQLEDGEPVDDGVADVMVAAVPSSLTRAKQGDDAQRYAEVGDIVVSIDGMAPESATAASLLVAEAVARQRSVLLELCHPSALNEVRLTLPSARNKSERKLSVVEAKMTSLFSQMDPLAANLVRRCYRLLDSENKGFIKESDVLWFTRHVGELPGGVKRFESDGDGKWDLQEFGRMCLAMIAHHGDEKFAKLIEGLAESLEGRLEERKAFWRSLAARTDHLFLFLLPGTYTVFLILMYSAPSALAPSPD